MCILQKRENYQQYKGAHYIIIKRLIFQEAITVLNVYAPDKRALKYVRQKNVRIANRNRQSALQIEYVSNSAKIKFIKVAISCRGSKSILEELRGCNNRAK